MTGLAISVRTQEPTDSRSTTAVLWTCIALFGAIPIAFHWVLALFALIYPPAVAPPPTNTADNDSHS